MVGRTLSVSPCPLRTHSFRNRRAEASPAYRGCVLFSRTKTQLPSAEQALPGRSSYPFAVPETHFVTGNRIVPPFPSGLATAVFGLGCFWGAERLFWQTPGVWSTPEQVPYERLLAVFWEGHDPTQGMRQGNDVGTQYRSAAYWASEEQRAAVEASLATYQQRLSDAGHGRITTQLAPAGPFFYAEAYHQQYLAKNPNGYCGLGGTGVSCPVGLFSKTESESTAEGVEH